MLANTDPDTIIDMSNSLEYLITSLNEEINEKVVKNSHDIDNLRDKAKSDLKVTMDVINFTFDNEYENLGRVKGMVLFIINLGTDLNDNAEVYEPVIC